MTAILQTTFSSAFPCISMWRIICIYAWMNRIKTFATLFRSVKLDYRSWEYISDMMESESIQSSKRNSKGIIIYLHICLFEFRRQVGNKTNGLLGLHPPLYCLNGIINGMYIERPRAIDTIKWLQHWLQRPLIGDSRSDVCWLYHTFCNFVRYEIHVSLNTL